MLEEMLQVSLLLQYTSARLLVSLAEKQILSSYFSPVPISNPLVEVLYSEGDNP